MKKLNFEIERLDNVMLSIKNGFIPESLKDTQEDISF